MKTGDFTWRLKQERVVTNDPAGIISRGPEDIKNINLKKRP